MNKLPDIKTEKDLEILTRAFYKKALADPVIGFFFTDIAKLDLETHIPKITKFWDMQIFGGRDYHGNPFQTHKAINELSYIKKEHFQHWVILFHTTVDELYAGDNADLVKMKSGLIASKMSEVLSEITASQDNNSMTQLTP
jgi:hemoglobin